MPRLLKLCCLCIGWPLFVLAQRPLPLQPHKLELARRYCREGINKHDPMRLAEGYYEYGKLYTAATDYRTATRWFIKSLRIVEKRGDSYELARLHVRLADLAALQVQYTATRDHAHRALAIARRCRSERGQIRACAVLGRLHDRNWAAEGTAAMPLPVANPDSGLYYWRQVEHFAYRLNDPMEVAQIKQTIGGRLAVQHNRRSIAYLTEALTIATQQNSPDRLGMMLNLGAAYLTFRQPGPAWHYISRAKALADSAYPNVYNIQFAVAYHLANYYRATSHWKQALALTDTLHQWEKRDLIADRNGAITRLNVEYETERKEALLKAQREELLLRASNEQIQQWFLWAVSVSLLLAVVMSIVFFRLYQKYQHVSRRNAELVREQNHRVKNNLQVIASLLSLQASRFSDKTAQQAVEESQLRVQAMAMLHQRLYDGEQLASVFLPDYFSELVEYVLVTYGFPNLQPELTIDPITLSADEALPLGLILNELATNACKYAFPHHPTPVFRLICQYHNGRIRVEVADNGAGFPTKPAQKTTGSFGMRLIQLEVEQLRGNHRFTSNGGTRFTLEFTSTKTHELPQYSDHRG